MITYQLNEHIVYKEEGAQSNSTNPEMLQIPLATNVANYAGIEGNSQDNNFKNYK